MGAKNNSQCAGLYYFHFLSLFCRDITKFEQYAAIFEFAMNEIDIYLPQEVSQGAPATG
jgi:hypothetical protein